MARPLLCATVMAETTGALRARRDAAHDADLVELRLDAVRNPDVAGALTGRRCPVIVTCRPRWEGGQFDGSEEERRRILVDALTQGADYVDLEWHSGLDSLVAERQGRNVVLSMHDFEGVPKDLAEQYRAMRATGAEVVKVAVHAERLSDLLPLLELGGTATELSRLVVIGMGQAGLPSRVLAAKFGSCWAYAGTVASGQIDPARMVGEFRFREVSAASEVYGVVGRPVGHSVSPAMHNAAFRTVGRDAVYVPLEAGDSDDFMQFADGLPVRGVSVTAPFKETLFERVRDVDTIAKQVGALNTLRRDSGHWTGVNTDVAGFLEPLRGRIELRGARAAILGAGGAARAVAVALRAAGAEVAVHARNLERAVRVAVLAAGVARTFPPPAGSWDLLVNTTPVGTHPDVDETPLPDVALDGRVVYDLVYNPRRTRLLGDAERAGCATVSGLEMLVAQARLQFEWWTGTRPPVEVFESAASLRLAHEAQAS